MRPCELACVMLLGLLPTYARPSKLAASPLQSTAFASSAPLLELLLSRGSPSPQLSRQVGVADSCSAVPGRLSRAGPERARGSSVLVLSAVNGANGNGRNKASHALDSTQVARPRPKVLVTGGAGYIGTHLCTELLQRDFDVVVLDNFMNSSPRALELVQRIAGRPLSVYEADTRDVSALRHVFDNELTISSVVHLAGLKAVGESVQKPNLYYDNNVAGSINLAKVMAEYGCKKMVFSSSATVYGDAQNCPIKESDHLCATSPYGRSKLIVEDMLRDTCAADEDWGVVILRYFNPIGAHPSGLLGEDPKGLPNNLMPYITRVATGKQPHLKVFGDDYPTRDGTGMRDYLHVMDLSRGHIAAIEKLSSGFKGAEAYNLGTGVGVTVLEMVEAFQQASRSPVPYTIEGRRPGDVAICYADPSKAQGDLNWRAEHSLADMCRDVWRWTMKNPDGYSTGVKEELLRGLRDDKVAQKVEAAPARRD